MERYLIIRCLEESPKVMGLSLKTAVFSVIIVLLSFFMMVKSIFSLGLNVLLVLLIKMDKRFNQKGSFEMYIDKIGKSKKNYVFDSDISSFIKK